jgi:hypothetical protein
MAMTDLYARLGGVSIRLRSEGLALDDLAELYSSFRSERTDTPDLDVVIECAPPDGGPVTENARDALHSALRLKYKCRAHPGVDRDRSMRYQVELGQRLLSYPRFVEALQAYHPAEGRWRSLFFSPTGACLIDEQVREARVVMLPQVVQASALQLDGYINVLLRRSLARQGGLLLHAAGVVHKNVAYLFMGPSGSGKTTISRAARKRGWSVLADDGLIVRRMPARHSPAWETPGHRFQAFRSPWNAMGSPWNGSFGAGPDSAEIRAVYFQRHGTANRWERLGRVAGSVRLIETAYPALKQLQDHDPATAVALLADMNREIPCYSLWFTIDCDFLDQIIE